MPTNKKPRKKYRPRGTFANPVDWVMEGFSRLTREAVVRTQAINHAALAALVHGNGTMEDWRSVTGALNMATVLDEQVYACEYQANMLEALRAHARCGVRQYNTGKFGYTGPDLTAVNAAMEVHDVQLEQATVGEIERAVAETKRRHNSPKEHFTVKQLAERQKDPHEQQEPQLFCP